MKNSLWVWLSNFLRSKPVSSYRGIELIRCKTDSVLISTEHQCPSDGKGNVDEHRCPYREHAGHYFVSPVILTIKEKIFIWLKLIQ